MTKTRSPFKMIYFWTSLHLKWLKRLSIKVVVADDLFCWPMFAALVICLTWIAVNIFTCIWYKEIEKKNSKSQNVCIKRNYSSTKIVFEILFCKQHFFKSELGLQRTPLGCTRSETTVNDLKSKNIHFDIRERQKYYPHLEAENSIFHKRLLSQFFWFWLLIHFSIDFNTI